MKHVYLVRHGQSEHHTRDFTGGWTDLPLTTLGREQAAKTAERLAPMMDGRSVTLFSSDLKRATQTAQAIAVRLAIDVRHHAGLREFNNGQAAGRTRAEAKAIELPRTEPTIDWVPYPGAETWREMTDRLAECMDHLSSLAQSTAIVVSHGGAATAIVKWWLRLPEPSRHHVHFAFDPCSITELTENEWDERVVVRLNDTAHLRAEVSPIPV